MFKSILVSAVCAVCALAQETQAPNKAMTINKTMMIQFGDVGPTLAMAGPLGFAGGNSRVTGAPYSAESQTEHVQVLADGNRIVQTTSSTIARDSEGRVRMERGEPSMGDPNAPRLITIEDPVGGFNYTLDSRTKTAFKLLAGKEIGKRVSFSTNALQPAVRMATGNVANRGGLDVGVATADFQIPINGKETLSSDNFAKTDLGSQNIEGVLAQGTRTTRTIPAGSMGNEQPIVITTETWYSPDLKVLVMSKSSDPRIGEITYKLTDIQRGEPSPILFQVPADYTVKDQPNFFYRKLDTGSK